MNDLDRLATAIQDPLAARHGEEDISKLGEKELEQLVELKPQVKGWPEHELHNRLKGQRNALGLARQQLGRSPKPDQYALLNALKAQLQLLKRKQHGTAFVANARAQVRVLTRNRPQPKAQLSVFTGGSTTRFALVCILLDAHANHSLVM